ncbi:hypothetical protein J3R83DRAFT_5940 [Lanmaoa asiatica]|nr:hypothetical protein J3R83DRAFT_5940 [Lanmaoa asiatica]
MLWTISCASIDTVRPSSSKGVRRCINEIADNLKHKSAKKKKKPSSTHDVPEKASHDLLSDSKALPESKATRRGRKATAPLRDSSRRSDEKSALIIADRLYIGIPSERDSPLALLGCESDPQVDEPPAKDEQLREDSGFSTGSLNLGACVTTERPDTLQSPRTPKIDIKDVQLDIRPSESDMTIWDGLQVVSVPDIRRIEMNCNTYPVGSRYARPPVVQTAYEGASPNCVTRTRGLPNVNLAAGIHIDRFWRTILDDDGAWGWYRDVFVPLSPRLFDKMEYREFTLVSRVWLGESCVEDEMRFGISMLLREVDMK